MDRFDFFLAIMLLVLGFTTAAVIFAVFEFPALYYNRVDLHPIIDWNVGGPTCIRQPYGVCLASLWQALPIT
jgi:hypothetical protein